MNYTLITANRNYSSWSLRPWVLMKALSIPFEDQMVLFEAENYDNFRKFAPMGKYPACTMAIESFGIHGDGRIFG